jgi:hypothetical protein
LYGALSYDDGKTWPVLKRIAPRNSAYGYQAVCQGPDGVIHLITSIDHYAFNEAWLESPQTPAQQALPVKERLAVVYDAAGLPSQASPAWRYVGAGREADKASLATAGRLSLETPADAECRWISDTPDGFGAVDSKKGFTVEIALQLLKKQPGKRGFDFDCAVAPAGGQAGGARYFLNIPSDAVYWQYRGWLTYVVTGQENADAIHVYRLAVRPDGVVQIYRDGVLLDVLPPTSGHDAGIPLASDRSYLQWGKLPYVDASVAHVAYDLSGAYAPK